jgi:hypothetical protein
MAGARGICVADPEFGCSYAAPPVATLAAVHFQPKNGGRRQRSWKAHDLSGFPATARFTRLVGTVIEANA